MHACIISIIKKKVLLLLSMAGKSVCVVFPRFVTCTPMVAGWLDGYPL